MPFTEDDDLKVAMELQRAIDEMHCSSSTTTTAQPLSSFASADLQPSQQPIYCPFGLPVLALFDTCQPFVPGAVSMLPLAPEEHSVVPTHNNPQHQWCIFFPSAFTPTPLLAQPLTNQKNKMMAVSVGSAVGGSDEKEVPLLQQQQLQKPIPVICKSIVVQRRRHDSSLAVMHVGSPVRNFKGKSALADFSNVGLWNTALPKVFVCTIKGKYSSNSSTFVSQIEFKVGDWVVHDGDQGFGIGEVIDCTLQPSKRFGATERQRAYRVATMKELQLFEGQRVFERKILKFLSSLSTLARSGVDMEAKYHDAYWSSIGSMDFLTVEMQADANTLTVHFEADSTIRIKDLSAMLNSYFKCRIWVRQIVDGNEQKQKKPKAPKTQTKSNNKNTDADDFATFTVSSSS